MDNDWGQRLRKASSGTRTGREGPEPTPAGARPGPTRVRRPHLPSVLDMTGSAELRTRMDAQLPMICGERAEGAGQPRGG